MAQVALTVNGRAYQIACDDGQEDHLKDLAEYVDKRIQELVASVGQVGEARLLVMASLLIADELSEAFRQLDDLDAGKAVAPGAVERGAVTPGAATPDSGGEAAVKALESYANRLESIATRLEGH